MSLLLAPAAAKPAPGGVEISAVGGKVTRVRVFGYADIEQSTPMRRDAVFRIASLTKQFTAVAVLRLVQDGALALDDPLELRLPNCPPEWRAITLRQLLSHTSGLTGDLAPLAAHLIEDWTPRRLIELYALLPLETAAGARWTYSNLNYWILGLVIEEASGLSYDDYVSAYIFAPARLRETRLGDWSVVVRKRARGYDSGANGELRNARLFSSSIGYSAGGYLSTADDLARWYAALGDGRVISPVLLAEALKPVRLADGESTGYGLGWYVSGESENVIAHHGGSTFGFRSYVYWRPGDGAFSAVLMNSAGNEPQEKARARLPRRP